MRGPLLLVVLSVLSITAVAAAADPTVSTVGAEERVAIWAFMNPGNYSAENVTLGVAGASLAWGSGTTVDTTAGDFALAIVLDNVDVSGTPGDVTILNGSASGPPILVAHQPGPVGLEDNYLYSGGGSNNNFGSSADLMVGYWGNSEWNRALLRVPTLPLPANATLVDARLRLYLHGADQTDAMDLSVHRITTAWTEFGSSWNDYDGSNPWNASGGGGDFDATIEDLAPGVTTTVGWYEWNVTALAQRWWTAAVPNHGLLVRQVNDDSRVSLGRKQFYSSDATNATLRPTLVLTYTATGSAGGVLESRPLDAGGVAVWGAIGWNATIPPGTSLSIQTRTGGTGTPDATWSPWSAPYGTSGATIASPTRRFLQHRAVLSATAGGTPILHDVAAAFERYASDGVVVTEPFRPATLVAWRRVGADWTGGTGAAVAIAYSQDDGATWAVATEGADLGADPARAVVLRIALATADTTQTPRVHAVSLGFAVARSGSGGVFFLFVPIVAGVPVWVLLVPIGLLAAWALIAPSLREPFRPTDLFLIHRDGRLVSRVGGEESPLTDEIAVAGMFTIVHAFVKDSFRGKEEKGGELRNFQVDERQVAIAGVGDLYLAILGGGTLPPNLERAMTWFLRGVWARHSAELRGWDGLSESRGDVPDALRWFLDRGVRVRIRWPPGQFVCG